MNLSKIKIVVNSEEPDEIKERLIIQLIAEDEKVIPLVMKILQAEREEKKELISDSNAELSRALIVLDDDKLSYSKGVIAEPKWVVGEIKKHYIKYKHLIRCNFKVDGLD